MSVSYSKERRRQPPDKMAEGICKIAGSHWIGAVPELVTYGQESELADEYEQLRKQDPTGELGQSKENFIRWPGYCGEQHSTGRCSREETAVKGNWTSVLCLQEV